MVCVYAWFNTTHISLVHSTFNTYIYEPSIHLLLWPTKGLNSGGGTGAELEITEEGTNGGSTAAEDITVGAAMGVVWVVVVVVRAPVPDC